MIGRIAMIYVLLCCLLIAWGTLIWVAFQVSWEDSLIVIISLIITTPMTVCTLYFTIKEGIF